MWPEPRSPRSKWCGQLDLRSGSQSWLLGFAFVRKRPLIFEPFRGTYNIMHACYRTFRNSFPDKQVEGGWTGGQFLSTLSVSTASGVHRMLASHRTTSPAWVVVLILDPQAFPTQNVPVKPLTQPCPLPPTKLPLLLCFPHG